MDVSPSASSTIATLRRVARGGRDESMGHAGCREVGAELVAGDAARRREREHLVPGLVQHPGRVQPLAARAGRTGRHPVRGARGQPVDVPGEVDRRVRRDGEDHARGALSRDEGGAEQSGVAAELGGDEHRAAVEAESLVHARRERGEQRVAGAGEAPADHDRLGGDRRGELRHGESEGVDRGLPHLARIGVAGLRTGEHVARAVDLDARCARHSAGRWRPPRRSPRGIRGHRRRSAAPRRRASVRSRPRSRPRGAAGRRGSASPRCRCR